ncbi:MAG: sigma-70 family RNA polymerase sigma factor [Solirubrobacterales bacterium]
MSSDERLVRRAAEGDPRAFEAIYQRYRQDLYRFCLAMVGNPQDAQDALQNTMVKILRALPGEERQIKLKPWLYRIARNESVEALRKRRDSAELEPHQAIAGGVAEAAETRERLRTLLADLEQLPERQRAALVMRELSGLDFDQIGAAFGSSAAVARQTLYEARLSLRQLESGREMRCAEVMRELSDADGRVTRRREIRAHLRGCSDCRAFRDEIAKRREDLAALSPLPLAASAALLQGVLGKTVTTGSATAGNGALAGSVGAGAGKAVATSAIVKSAATVAVVAVVGVSAAERGGVVDLPLPGEKGGRAAPEAAERRPGTVNSVEPANAVSPRAKNAAPGQPDDGGRERQDDENLHAEGAGRPHPEDDAVATPGNYPPDSQAGLTPPGGGYGRSASKQKGPDGPPDAAAHGQQTAAANKPAQAASPPGDVAAAKGQGSQQGGAGPDEKPAPPRGKAPAEPPASQAPAKPPSHMDSGPAPQGSGAAPPGLQR